MFLLPGEQGLRVRSKTWHRIIHIALETGYGVETAAFTAGIYTFYRQVIHPPNVIYHSEGVAQ